MAFLVEGGNSRASLNPKSLYVLFIGLIPGNKIIDVCGKTALYLQYVIDESNYFLVQSGLASICYSAICIQRFVVYIQLNFVYE